MPRLQLVIANKNGSSWSMRPWVLLTEAGIPFEEVLVPFGAPDWQARVGSPSGRVPLLRVREEGGAGLRIWDSLAIAEFLAEAFPEKQLWPSDPAARAVARAASAEMHSGFADMRRECSMDLVLRRERILSAKAAADVRRVDALLADCRTRFGGSGDLLFGRFSIADAMFAPVASRARTYGLQLSSISQRYLDALWALPSVERWAADARAEVDAGIHDPVSHGALFSRAEAEHFAADWIARWNKGDLDGLLALCAEGVRARAQSGLAALRARWSEERATSPAALRLTSCAWDGDVNRLTLCVTPVDPTQGAPRAEVLSFDDACRVSALESFGG